MTYKPPPPLTTNSVANQWRFIEDVEEDEKFGPCWPCLAWAADRSYGTAYQRGKQLTTSINHPSTIATPHHSYERRMEVHKIWNYITAYVHTYIHAHAVFLKHSHTHIYTQSHSHLHTYSHAHTNTLTRNMQTHITYTQHTHNTHKKTLTNIHTYALIHTQLNVDIRVCVRTLKHTYVFTHALTCTFLMTFYSYIFIIVIIMNKKMQQSIAYLYEIQLASQCTAAYYCRSNLGSL